MVNLATLSALLRTIRQQGGVDGAAGPVERIAQVRRIAADGEAQVAARLREDDASGRSAAAPRADATLVGSRAPAQRLVRDATSAATRAQPEAATASASLDLTRGGALVAAALKARGSASPQSARIDAPLPLVATARAGATELARALARTIADSGLFYESHLARWARREYTASALEREPQAGWRGTADAAATPDAPRAAVLPEPVVALLTRQLDALDARQIAWMGELWPGQRATITLEEGDDGRERDAEAAEGGAPVWRTTIAIDLPSLGPVAATLAMRGDVLDLGLRVPAADAHARLAEARGALAAALADSRIALRGFAVDA